MNPAIPAAEAFDGTWPYRARYNDAPGFRVHYVDEGSGPETLLLLHGEPTWSYLFRQQIPVWVEHSRVIAVDHMGFGKSAAPQDRTYWLQDHINNPERFVLALAARSSFRHHELRHESRDLSGRAVAAKMVAGR